MDSRQVTVVKNCCFFWSGSLYSLRPRGLATILAGVIDLNRDVPELLALGAYYLDMPFGMAVWTGIYGCRFAVRGCDSRPHSRKAASSSTPWTLEHLGINGEARRSLASTTITTSSIQPVEFLLDASRQRLKVLLNLLGRPRRAVVLCNQCCCWASIYRNRLPAFHQRGENRASRTAEGSRTKSPGEV